jgi:hypothetical protein
MNEAEFDPIYWASKSPEILNMVERIKAVTVLNTPAEEIPMKRQAIAQETATMLAAAGRTGQADLVDNSIMVWLWGAFYAMSMRLSLNEDYISDATVTYHIKVSITPSDFPVYVAPQQ